MKYLKKFRLYEDINKPGSGTGIMREVGQFETEINKKLYTLLGNEGQKYMNWREPDFSAEKIRKYKDVTKAFFTGRPFSVIYGPIEDVKSGFIEVSKKMVGLTNIQTLMQYYSDLFSFIDRIKEMTEKLNKEAENEKEEGSFGGPGEIAKTAKDYNNWLSTLKIIKSIVDSPDFLGKIIPDKKELEVSYKKKDGKGVSDGNITGIKIKDDGKIEFTIDNENIGKVKKDFDELVMKKSEESDVDTQKDIVTKLSDLKVKKPYLIKKISNFVDFISKEENKDNAKEIYKIIGI